jgi:septal ring factor EnvC (AmiA/AmiB activator)
MQQNIASLGESIRQTRLEQAALLAQLQRLEQPVFPPSTVSDDETSYPLVSGSEVTDVEEQNRQIQTVLGEIRHVIEVQRKDMSSLTTAMYLLEKSADSNRSDQTEK